MTILQPVLALVIWTFIIWFWMYVTRLAAIRKAKINPSRLKRSEDLACLPLSVKQIADNYNHLHEQPTVFYALAFYSHLVGVADPLNISLAWIYVGLRVVHSMVQCTKNFVPLRFVVFVTSSVVLMAMTARNILALILSP